MSGGYYNLLGITREAEAEDVAKAYRKMALKHHPDLNKDSGVDTRTSFAQVSEAYEVLSNARYRALYDGFGEDGLTSGADAYSFSGDADGIFKAFFGVANPFQVMGNNADATKHLFFSESAVAAKAAQQKPREISLTCTLEEVYSGASHDVPYTAAMVDREGKMYKEVAATIQVDIERGLPDGSRLKYSGKGGRDSASTGEVIATVNLAKHPHFVWDDSDLIFTHKITLEQALVGFSVEVMTLDHRKLSVFVNDVVHPQYRKVIAGEGMPVYRGGGKRGDLVMCFETEFPTYLTDGQKKEISRIFSSTLPNVAATARPA